MMRLAAIDIGTNSLHMIVVQVRPDLSFEVIDREKEMVRLGAGGLDGRALTPEAMHAALQVLSKFRRLAESHRSTRSSPSRPAPSREAENGGEFLQRRHRSRPASAPRVISGTEEARLIHLAAAYGVGVPGRRRRSSSTSAAAASRSRAAPGRPSSSGRSFKLGVIRLTERFVKSDPLAPRDERKLVRHIDAELGEYLDQIARAGFDRVIGTSGTILSLGAVAVGGRGTRAGAPLRNRRISAKQLRRVRKDAGRARSREAAARARASSRGAPTSPSPARSCSTTILRRLGADRDHAVRPVAARRAGPRLHRAAPQGDRAGRSLSRRPPPQRRRAAERCNYWPEHAQQVARLALALFDQTRAHPRPDRSRARVARIRRAPARHRRPHQLRAAPQALVLPDQERRSARLRAATRSRPSRSSRAITGGDAEAATRRLRRSAGASGAASCARWPRSCGSPRASTAATRRPSPASSFTTAATTRCCSCGRPATPSSSSGRRRGTPRRSSG